MLVISHLIVFAGTLPCGGDSVYYRKACSACYWHIYVCACCMVAYFDFAYLQLWLELFALPALCAPPWCALSLLLLLTMGWCPYQHGCFPTEGRAFPPFKSSRPSSRVGRAAKRLRATKWLRFRLAAATCSLRQHSTQLVYIHPHAHICILVCSLAC